MNYYTLKKKDILVVPKVNTYIYLLFFVGILPRLCNYFILEFGPLRLRPSLTHCVLPVHEYSCEKWVNNLKISCVINSPSPWCFCNICKRFGCQVGVGVERGVFIVWTQFRGDRKADSCANGIHGNFHQLGRRKVVILCVIRVISHHQFSLSHRPLLSILSSSSGRSQPPQPQRSTRLVMCPIFAW